MPVDLQQTILHRLNETQLAIAPLREGASPATPANAEGGVGFKQNSLSGVVGCRVPFAMTDFTGGDFITFQLASNAFDAMRRADVVANGGVRFLIEDMSGNWARWTIHGRDIPSNPGDLGVFKAFTDRIGRSGNPDGSNVFYINRFSTPAASSGTVDYSSIAAVEFGANMLSSGEFALYLGLLGVANRPVLTGGSSSNPQIFQDFGDEYRQANGIGGDGFRTPRMFVKPSAMFGGANTVQTTCHHGFEIGNGSSGTYFEDANFELAFYPSQKTILNAPLRGYGIAFTDTDVTTRDGIIRANATCNFNDFSFTGALDDYRLINESSLTTLNIGRFFGAYDIQCGALTANTVTFSSCSTLTVTEQTTLTNCSIISQSASGKGLYIVGPPQTYSNLDLLCGDKITINPTAAGTYNLTSLRLGSTVNIHNESAIHDIIVLLPSGATVTTSTAGGQVSTPLPPKTLTINGLIDGCAISIYDDDSTDDQDLGTLLASDENLSGTAFTFEHSGSPNEIIVQMIADSYRETWLPFTLSSENQTLTIRPEIEDDL